MTGESESHERLHRRSFLHRAGLGALVAAAAPAVAVGCSSDDGGEAAGNSAESGVADDESQLDSGRAAAELPLIEWEMPTSWPTSLPTLWGGAEYFCERVAALTSGGLSITPRPAGELTGPFDILPAVSDGSHAIGITAGYYYTDLNPVLAFGASVPFGLTHRQGLSWLHAAGGLELLQSIYARDFNAIQFPVGATGAQMGGWFRRDIQSLDDFQGLRMRIPGLGGQVMQRLGVEAENISADELAQSLAGDRLDAAEFVGPADDQALGLEQAANFYFYPGFWEPGLIVEVEVNLDEWNTLPVSYQEALSSAAFETTTVMMARYDALNGQALNDLVAGGTELRLFPDDVLAGGRAAAGLLLDEFAAADADFARVLNHWRTFRRQVRPWFSLAEAALLQ